MYCITKTSDELTIEDLSTLVNELQAVRDIWFVLGVQLKVPLADLRCIRADYRDRCSECLLEMLSAWLTITTLPTWQNVIDALCCAAVERPLVAEHIRKRYCSHSSECSTVYLTPKQIVTEMDELENEFDTLKDDVFESVKTQPVDTFKFKLTSFKVKDKEYHMEYIKEIIDKKDSVVDILIELNCYLNYLNYEILQHILTKFKNADLQIRMDEYKMKIKNFFRCTRICDFIECWPIHGCEPPVEKLQHFIEIKSCKDWETCTLEDLDNLKGRLATKLLLPKFILILEKASSGSLAVTFSIPPSLVTQLQCDIQNTELKVFLDMDIEIITVDGVVCYVAPLLQYTTQLKQLYTSRSPLQPLTDSKHKHLLQFRLARIEKQTISQGDMDRFTRESLRGDMDDVIYKKTPMDVSELGVMADNSQPKVVLIEGAPGVGKTTFAWDQCRQWAEGKLLQDYSIVLLLPLRDNNIRQITSLSGLFQHSKRQVRDEVSRRVVESNGKGCLIWLEAWDELGNDLRSDSLFTQLIEGIQLPAATIYITSRPWATIYRRLLKQMGDRISQHTELLALAKEEVENEIREIIITIHSMTESESGFDFKTHIESNPMIRAAMYTPVSAAIVEQVFKSSPHNPPTTVTQLYSAYVLMRLEQYLTEHSKYSDMKMKVRTLSDLPERVLTDFHQLCRLAYLGLSQQMIVFSSLPEGVSTLGLLQSVPQVYDEGEDQVSYNFLHYTVQEYLAALHISHLQPQEQMTIIDTKCLRMVRRTVYGSKYYEATQWKTTFQFLAGITKLAEYPVEFLSNLLSKDKVTMYSWLYESQNLPLLTSVLGSDERYMSLSYSATITDYFVAGYCLAHSNCTWSIQFVSVDDVAMEFLSKGCNHQLPETDISSQLVLLSSYGSITADVVKQFLTIPNSLIQHIQHLHLSDNNLDRRACDVLAEGVQRMPCLETLDLSNNSHIGCGGAVQLLSSLLINKLRELNMYGTVINDPDFECLTRYIHSTASLQKLSIGSNDISVESIDSLCKALSTNSSMRSLNMSVCHLTTSHCVCLGQLLRHPIHCKIEKLYLSSCSLTSDGVGEVLSGLSDNHTLRELDLNNNNQIRSEGAVTIATMLKTNSSLETLYLDGCSIDSSGGVELCTALERNKTLRKLSLSWNALGDDGVSGLIVGLENNSSLEELWLYGDESLGEEGVSLLLKCVEERNTSLKKLSLPMKYEREISSTIQSRCEVWWL